jgi:DNA-binding transcriptional regulator GbsR (MarR family)
MKKGKPNLELIFNFMCDFKKKDIEPKAQAQIIRYYLKENNMSVRGLARELGISHSSIMARLKWGSISDRKIAKLQKQGYTRKEIFRDILSDKDKDIAQDHLVCKINEFHELVRSCLHDNQFSPQTLTLLDSLVNDINRLRSKIERLNDGRRNRFRDKR